MRKNYTVLILLCCLVFLCRCNADGQSKDLKLVFIRHAERPENGDNLTCQGLNRSLQLPGLLYRKFGAPSNVYVPALGMGESTKRTRMLQTISPFAIKYNLNVNTAFEETDYRGLGDALLRERGTVLIVWEHKNIAPILEYLGIRDHLRWASDDYDTIWIVTFHNGKPTLIVDNEHLHPALGCSF
jgi:hypothetical protein